MSGDAIQLNWFVRTIFQKKQMTMRSGQDEQQIQAEFEDDEDESDEEADHEEGKAA